MTLKIIVKVIYDELKDLLAHMFILSLIGCEIMINPAMMRANSIPKDISHVLPLHPSSWIPIYLFATFRGDIRVTYFDSKAYRTLTPRSLRDDKRKRRKRNIASPTRTNFVISHLSWYRRTNYMISKPNHFSKSSQSCLQKNVTSFF